MIKNKTLQGNVLKAIQKEVKQQKLEIVKEIHPLTFLVRSKDKKSLYLLKGELLKKDLLLKERLYKRAENPGSRIIAPKLVLSRPNGVMMFEYIEGNDINSLIDSNPAEYFRITTKLAEDYLLFALSVYTSSNGKNKRLANAIKWTKESLKEWSKSLIDEKLADEDDVRWLAKVIAGCYNNKSNLYLFYSHGNIIGDHVIKTKRGYFLLDLEGVLRPGGQYYDALRTIDYAILKTRNVKAILPTVNAELKKISEAMGERPMQAVFALRCIGALGKDILQNPHKDKIPDLKKKIAFFRKHIEIGFNLT